MALERIDQETDDVQWLEYAEWYQTEMKHPLLQSQRIGQSRHENMLRALILKKLGAVQNKQDNYLSKLKQQVGQMNSAERWIVKADQGNDW